MGPSDRDQQAAPIVIVGTGRCGSTLLHRVLALHDELGWLSTYNEVFPTQSWLSSFSSLYRTGLPDRVRHLKAFPKPFEAYRYWEHYLPGFSRRDRPLGAADVPAAGIGPVRSASSRVLRFQRRPRLLVKVTGWSRIAYFDAVFPGTTFIALKRDPRAVVSSWVRAGWLDVTSAPDSPSWQWGEVPPGHLARWRELGGGPLLSVALKMRLDLDDIAANASVLPGRVHEASYEDLTANPAPTLRSICRACGLAWTETFERAVGRVAFYDATDTWRKYLTDEEGELILEFMRSTDTGTRLGQVTS